MKTALYRHFDAFKKLLYVGVSLDPFVRLCGHKCSSEWYQNITIVTFEWFDSRTAALVAEEQAIMNERPLYNRTKADTSKSPPPKVVTREQKQIAKDQDKTDNEYWFHRIRKRPVLNTWVSNVYYRGFQTQFHLYTGIKSVAAERAASLWRHILRTDIEYTIAVYQKYRKAHPGHVQPQFIDEFS